jgi:hypothetical protein
VLIVINNTKAARLCIDFINKLDNKNEHRFYRTRYDGFKDGDESP